MTPTNSADANKPLTMPQVLALSEKLDDPVHEGHRILLAAAFAVSPYRNDLAEFIGYAGSLFQQLRTVDPALLASIAANMHLPGLKEPTCP